MENVATFSQYLELGQMIKRGELSKKLVQAIIEGQVEIKSSGKPTVQTFTLRVDHSKSLEDLIKEGNYDWVNEEIIEVNFPVEQKIGFSEMEVVLVCFNDEIISAEATKRLNGMDLEPGGIVELLVLGATMPELQKRYPIVALGSTSLAAFDCLDVPYIFEEDGKRCLSLEAFDPEDHWSNNDHFLAVRRKAT